MGLLDSIFGPSAAVTARIQRLEEENRRLRDDNRELAARAANLSRDLTAAQQELTITRTGRAADMAAFDKAQTDNPWYRAFSDFEWPLLDKIAAAKNRLPDTLRKLIVTLLAEPTDLGHLGAIKDYIIDEMRLPPYVVIGGEKVDLTARRGLDWWGRRSGLGGHVAAALTRQDDRKLSVAELCHLTEVELGEVGGIGPKSMTKIKKWLAGLGLSLRDPAAE